MGKAKTDNTSKQVDDILNSLKNKKPEGKEDATVESKTEGKKQLPEVPRGRPKSGRIWKSQKTRFISIKKTKGVHKTFAEKEELRQKLKSVKEASKAIRDQKLAEKEEKKERRRINLKRTEENKLKSEIVHVISNSAKIKRMKKKQLRFIQKRDTTNISK